MIRLISFKPKPLFPGLYKMEIAQLIEYQVVTSL
jgi:hypothetical protein